MAMFMVVARFGCGRLGGRRGEDRSDGGLGPLAPVPPGDEGGVDAPLRVCGRIGASHDSALPWRVITRRGRGAVTAGVDGGAGQHTGWRGGTESGTWPAVRRLRSDRVDL